MAEKIKQIKEKFLNEKGIKFIVLIGIIGMLLIMVSSFIPEKKEPVHNVSEINFSETYKIQAEEDLAELLSSINGVGEVKVMLSLVSTEKYVYAEENKNSRSNGESQNTQQNENKLVMIEKDGDESALIQQISSPEIGGVVVVCEGGDNAKICERVYKTVSTVLGIPISKIYVTKINK